MARNGYLPTQSVQTGIGYVQIKVSRVCVSIGDGINFSSALLPPYL